MAQTPFTYLHNSSSNPLGLPFGQSHQPNPRLNLFHIDNQEMHLNMIQCSYFDSSTKLLDSGSLHLCSRSLIFDSDQIQVPLLKMRYNQQFHIDQFTGDQLIYCTDKTNDRQSYNNASSGVQTMQNSQQNFFTYNKATDNTRQNAAGNQKFSTCGGAYNESQSPLNIQDQQHSQVKGPLHNTSQNSQKTNKITVKKQSIQTKNRTSDSIGSISPSKKVLPAHSQIRMDDPKKQGFLKDFYTFLVDQHMQAQLQQQRMQNNTSLMSFQEQISELQFLLISVKQILRTPRQPPGPQYQEKDANQSKFSHDSATKYVCFILSSEEIPRQQQFIHSLMQFIYPDAAGQNQNLYLSEDDILKKYIDSEKKKFLQYCQHTEQSTGQKYLIKQIVKRVTIEGEHTYLMLMKQENNQYVIELLPIMNAPHQTFQITIPLQQIKFALSYRYMYEYKSTRVVTYNLDEYIIVFKTQQAYDKAMTLIQKHAVNNINEDIQQKEYYQAQWIKGVISNAEYLLYVNFIAHRSFNDLTQYPVFPWVIQDFKNDDLNFQKQITFRDLGKPIGALSADKLEQFKSKYFEIINKQSTMAHTIGSTFENQEKPYMYLSHYSTPGIVLYYLIRQVPSYLLKVQNEGYGGPPDRIFYDIGSSWHNGFKVLADNKELIPEFYLGDGTFLKNLNQVELGLNHLEEKVHDVTLPPWAANHQDFIFQMREALESNHVSATLNKWIDLVFGYQQNGDQASLANNLFQPTTSEENIDFSQITSPLERQAMEAQIRNFGQTPVQLFREGPHPERQFRTLLLTQGKQLDTAEGLEQQCEVQLAEIENLRRAYDENSQINEEKIMKQMKEFQYLDEIRKKQIHKYKEDGAKQIAKYKQMVEFLKQQKKAIKQEMEGQFKQKEQQYLQIIQELKASGGGKGSIISNSKQAAQLSTFFEKNPGSIEYVKALDVVGKEKGVIKESKKKNSQIIGSSGGSRLGMQIEGAGRNLLHQSSGGVSQAKQTIKLKTINH